MLMLDGRTTSICFVNRSRNALANLYGETLGDRHAEPDDSCDRFVIDAPPISKST